MEKISFRAWVETIGTNCLVITRDGKMAKIDQPGWFSGQWFDIPENVYLPDEIKSQYRGI